MLGFVGIGRVSYPPNQSLTSFFLTFSFCGSRKQLTWKTFHSIQLQIPFLRQQKLHISVHSVYITTNRECRPDTILYVDVAVSGCTMKELQKTYGKWEKHIFFRHLNKQNRLSVCRMKRQHCLNKSWQQHQEQEHQSSQPIRQATLWHLSPSWILLRQLCCHTWSYCV